MICYVHDHEHDMLCTALLLLLFVLTCYVHDMLCTCLLSALTLLELLRFVLTWMGAGIAYSNIRSSARMRM